MSWVCLSDKVEGKHGNTCRRSRYTPKLTILRTNPQTDPRIRRSGGKFVSPRCKPGFDSCIIPHEASGTLPVHSGRFASAHATSAGEHTLFLARDVQSMAQKAIG